MLRWDWTQKMGEITLVQMHEDKAVKFKLNIYLANCLGAVIYEDKRDNTYQVMAWWSDVKHLKNCLGLTSKFKDNLFSKKCNKTDYYEKVRLNTYYADARTMAMLFAKGGIKVELYYREGK